MGNILGHVQSAAFGQAVDDGLRIGDGLRAASARIDIKVLRHLLCSLRWIRLNSEGRSGIGEHVGFGGACYGFG